LGGRGAPHLDVLHADAVEVFARRGVRDPELRRDGLNAEEHNFLYPQQEKQVPYVTRKLQGAEGPFVAATDYSHAVPDMIRQFVPGEYATLGADGFGFSD
ncbi:hypothetical protein SB767_29690, partial [Bacillus sp. SIMBA_069]